MYHENVLKNNRYFNITNFENSRKFKFVSKVFSVHQKKYFKGIQCCKLCSRTITIVKQLFGIDMFVNKFRFILQSK